MKIIVKGKPLRYGGKLYRTGDMANVSRQHARVLTALKRAVPAPQVAAAKSAAPSAASQAPPASAPHTRAPSAPSPTAAETVHNPQQQPHVETAQDPALTHPAHSAPPPAQPQRFQRAVRDPKAKPLK